MDLKNLQKITTKHAQKAEVPKNSKFVAALKKGLFYLEKAHREGFKNADTVQISCECLIDSITFRRNDIRPYMALAYLFSILEDFKTAEEYAYLAMKLEPDNADVTNFFDEMSAFKKQKKKNQQSAPPKDAPLDIQIPETGREQIPATPNYNALYRELETFILEKVKNLFSSEHQHIEPTINQKKFKLLQQSVQNLNRVIKYIEQQLAIIEEGLDVASLRQKMSPFNALMRRYMQSINTSKMLMEINDTIELWSFKTNKQVQVVNQNLTMSALTYGRVDVNRMMDGCDLIADQLDHLSEDESIDITLVEKSYEKLLELVESLNGMVDDTTLVQNNKNKLSDILS